MLKSPVYMKKPKPQKLLSRVKGGVGLICSSVHTVGKGAGKCNPASLLFSGPQVTSSSEAMQEAEPQESLLFGLGWEPKLISGKKYLEETLKTRKQTPWLELLQKSSQHTTTGSFKKGNNR